MGTDGQERENETSHAVFVGSIVFAALGATLIVDLFELRSEMTYVLVAVLALSAPGIFSVISFAFRRAYERLCEIT